MNFKYIYVYTCHDNAKTHKNFKTIELVKKNHVFNSFQNKNYSLNKSIVLSFLKTAKPKELYHITIKLKLYLFKEYYPLVYIFCHFK